MNSPQYNISPTTINNIRRWSDTGYSAKRIAKDLQLPIGLVRRIASGYDPPVVEIGSLAQRIDIDTRYKLRRDAKRMLRSGEYPRKTVLAVYGDVLTAKDLN